MVYGDFKDKPRRTTSNKVLRDKVYNLNNLQDDRYQSRLVSRVYKCFYEKSMLMVE